MMCDHVVFVGCWWREKQILYQICIRPCRYLLQPGGVFSQEPTSRSMEGVFFYHHFGTR